jgi:hypothetical protein
MIGAEFDEKEERPAYVRFETRAIESKAMSMEAGRAVCVDVDFALVTPPYSKDLVEIKADQWLMNAKNNVKNGRIPQKWLDYWLGSFEAFKEGKETPLDGMPIKDWGAITPAQIKNLLAIQIRTVEDLAAVNDQGLRRIGMGAQELKRKAVNWLKTVEDHGSVTLEITKLQAENEQLKVANADLTDKNKVLMGKLEFASQKPAENIDVSRETISVSDILDTEQTAITPVELSLSDQYLAKFGKPPHHRMKDETIREKLRE